MGKQKFIQRENRNGIVYIELATVLNEYISELCKCMLYISVQIIGFLAATCMDEDTPFICCDNMNKLCRARICGVKHVCQFREVTDKIFLN